MLSSGCDPSGPDGSESRSSGLTPPHGLVNPLGECRVRIVQWRVFVIVQMLQDHEWSLYIFGRQRGIC
ncbi:hypothetical protein Mapa_000759 [Marchantia paleacea]|nr:hypothetical protein Mapa_000759 [Marchantia paleacea]